ncbi:MAG: NAD(P)H-quinone oxidoreductase [Deinococcota bacterium]
MAETMHAIFVQADSSLTWQDTEVLSIGRDEVLIDIYATAVNRADLAQRRGLYPPPAGASDILGLEAAGIIRKVGWEVDDWHVGDAVCTLLSGGGYAEQVAVHHDLLMPLPHNWNFVQAAALPEVFFTAFLNLFIEAKLDKGERVLIHGGASGVGTAAIQLAKQAGSTVIVTASSEAKLTVCSDLGADVTINYREQDFAEVINDLGGVDVVLDMVGGSYLAKHLDVLRPNGRLVVIATLGGSQAEINLRTMMSKRLSLKGSTLRSRPIHEKISLKEQFMKRFWRLVEQGAIYPILDSVFAIQDAEQAHAHMLDNRNVGKIVLSVRPDILAEDGHMTYSGIGNDINGDIHGERTSNKLDDINIAPDDATPNNSVDTYPEGESSLEDDFSEDEDSRAP